MRKKPTRARLAAAMRALRKDCDGSDPSRNLGTSSAADQGVPGNAKAAKAIVERRRMLEVGQYPNESAETAIARAKLSPVTQAAVTLSNWGNFSLETLAEATDPKSMVSELETQAKNAISNNLSRLEAMLAVQAHALDAIFHECARRAAANLGDFPQAVDLYMRVGLRAQSQCRCTIEALAEIKNPKSFTVVGQANVAHGPQQVNNGVVPARAENVNPANELLEHRDGNRLEQSAPSLTGAADPSMVAVGKVDRATDA